MKTFKEFLSEAKPTKHNNLSSIISMWERDHKDPETINTVNTEGIKLMKKVFRQYKITAAVLGYLLSPKADVSLRAGKWNVPYKDTGAIEKMRVKLVESGALVETSSGYKLTFEVAQAMRMFFWKKISIDDDMLETFKALKAHDKWLRASF